jgi:hypothetical protein
MLGHWYALLFLSEALPPAVKPGGGVQSKKPQRHRYEVDQFQYVTAQPQKSDDDECLLLLLM